MVINMRWYKNFKFIFVHVPRTSGTSVLHLINRATDGYIYQDKNMGVLDGTPLIGTIDYKHLSRKDFLGLSGHFHHTKYDFTGVPKITWMRDPVDRVVSQWRITRMKILTPRSGEVHKKTLREKLSPVDFSALDEVTNLMTQYLESVDNFDFIGFAESWDEDIKLLFKKFDLGAVPPNPEKVNATPIRRRFRYNISDKEREEIGRINNLDCELYKEAWNKFKGG